MTADDAIRTPVEHLARFDEAVAQVVAAAAAGAPGFRRRLASAGLGPDELRSTRDLDRLPVLDKDRLLAEQRDDPPFGGYLLDGAAVARVFQSPGPIYEPQREGGDPWRWGTALAAAGFGAGDTVLNAFGYHLSPAGAMFDAAVRSLGGTVLPGGVGNKEAQVEACHDLAVTGFVGPPSYLKALLDTAAAEGTRLGLERAFVTAEPLPPALRAALEAEVATVRQGYGTAETGLLGFECERREGLHVPDDAVVQIVDLTTGEAREDDGQGQIVVTLLDPTYAMVRFGTGDLSSWLLEPCGCGRATPRIAGWQGRVGDAVKVRGMFLHPAQLDATIRRIPDVARYRTVVARDGHRDVVRCQVLPRGDGRRVDADEVAQALRDRLRLRVEVQVVDELPEDVPPFEDARTWD